MAGGFLRKNGESRSSRHVLKVPSWRGSSKSRKAVPKMSGLLRVFMVEDLGAIIISFVPPRDNTNQVSMIEGLCSCNRWFRLQAGRLFPRIRCCPAPLLLTIPCPNAENPEKHTHIKFSIHGATLELEDCYDVHEDKKTHKSSWSGWFRSMLPALRAEAPSPPPPLESRVPEGLRFLRDHGPTPMGRHVREVVIFWPRHFIPPPQDLDGAFSECRALETLRIVGCIPAPKLLLRGEVPQSVTNVVLESHAEIAGAVEALADLGNLAQITFRLCTLTGQTFAQLAALGGIRSLGLTADELTAIPETVGGLKALEDLDISVNRITALSPAVCGLSRLRILRAANNRLGRLPEDLHRLAALRELDASHNRIQELPARLGELVNLRRLDLAHNRLTALPRALRDLGALEDLNLSSNLLHALPEEVGRMPSLAVLNACRNELEAVPEALGLAKRLEVLDVSSNNLVTVPGSIAQLTQLRVLNMSHNRLARLPAEFGGLKSLERLDASSNALEQLPDSFGDAESLKVVNLSRNRLTKLPDSMSNMERLERFNVSANCLSHIPRWVSSVPAILSGGIDISSNHLLVEDFPILYLSTQDTGFDDVFIGKPMWNMRPKDGCRKCQGVSES